MRYNPQTVFVFGDYIAVCSLVSDNISAVHTDFSHAIPNLFVIHVYRQIIDGNLPVHFTARLIANLIQRHSIVVRVFRPGAITIFAIIFTIVQLEFNIFLAIVLRPLFGCREERCTIVKIVELQHQFLIAIQNFFNRQAAVSLLSRLNGYDHFIG